MTCVLAQPRAAVAIEPFRQHAQFRQARLCLPCSCLRRQTVPASRPKEWPRPFACHAPTDWLVPFDGGSLKAVRTALQRAPVITNTTNNNTLLVLVKSRHARESGRTTSTACQTLAHATATVTAGSYSSEWSLLLLPT